MPTQNILYCRFTQYTFNSISVCIIVHRSWTPHYVHYATLTLKVSYLPTSAITPCWRKCLNQLLMVRLNHVFTELPQASCSALKRLANFYPITIFFVAKSIDHSTRHVDWWQSSISWKI